MKRFWDKVKKSDGCWEWQAAISSAGYGFFWLDGGHHYAHRVAWALEHGAEPPNLVLHRCDNRKCVRIDHLFVGDYKDNSADAISKGRTFRPIGEKNGMHRLNAEDVRSIRTRYAAGGVYQRELAEEFGVTEAWIWQIVKMRKWKTA